MDSLQGIPVEYKLDTFNKPRTGTTLCHPKNWLCRSDAQLSSRHLALNSPLGHFNGDNARLSPNTRHETHGDSKVQSLQPTWLSLNYNEHNPSHVRRRTLPSQPSQLLRSQLRLKNTTSPRVLQHQKQTQYSKRQNKNLFIKIHFDYRHLTSSSLLPLIPNDN